MLVVAFVDSLGTGLFLTGSALFFTRSLGLSASQVGLGLSLAAVVGFACSVPVGRLSDRIGARTMLVVLQFWRGAWMVAYPFAGNFGWFLVVACLLGAGEWAAPPVVQSLVGSLAPQQSRVRTMSAMMVVRNVGFTIGAAAAAGTIASGGGASYRWLVFTDAASFLISGVILLRLPATAGDATAADATARTARADRVATRPGPRYLALAVLNGVLSLHMVLLSVGLPLWVVGYTRAPGALLGAIVALNTLLAVGLQMRLSHGVDGARAGSTRQLRAGSALAACCLLVAPTGAGGGAPVVALVLLATAALTVGEVYQAVGGWAVSFALSPPANRAYFLSVYNLGQTGAMIVGPWLVTTLVLQAGAAGWTLLGAVLVASGAAVPLLARAHPLTQPAADQTTG